MSITSSVRPGITAVALTTSSRDLNHRLRRASISVQSRLGVRSRNPALDAYALWPVKEHDHDDLDAVGPVSITLRRVPVLNDCERRKPSPIFVADPGFEPG